MRPNEKAILFFLFMILLTHKQVIEIAHLTALQVPVVLFLVLQPLTKMRFCRFIYFA